MRRLSKLILVWLALALTLPLRASDDDVVMKAMRDEMARSVAMQLQGLQKPYFVSFRIQDLNDVTVAASMGSLDSSKKTRRRTLEVQIRVGDYKLDNSNYISFGSREMGGAGTLKEITVDDNYAEVRRQIWLATDTEYKSAVKLLAAKQAALQNQRSAEEVPDFSQEQPNKHFESWKPSAVDVAALEAAARKASAILRQVPEPQSSSVTIHASEAYTRYLSSEGTEYTKPYVITYMEVEAGTQADDGIPLDDTEQVFVQSVADLSGAKVTEQVQQIVARLQKLRTTGSFDRYNGPVLFEAEAGPEVFAQVFAPALVASRDVITDSPQAQAFLEQMVGRFNGGNLADRIGGRVLPDSVKVVDDPQLASFEGQPLYGTYVVDDDGLPARSNTVIESGILKLVLVSRTPVRGATHSTGSRRGLSAVPSNMIFTSGKTATDGELQKMLLERAKSRGLEYAVVVRRAGGSYNEFMQTIATIMKGEASTGNTMLEVYKLYADGREELVHGEQLVSMTPSAFKDIVAVGTKPVIYNSIFVPGFSSLMMIGLRGEADVTMVPVVSYVAPSLLFEEATLKKASGPFPKAPVTSPPQLKPVAD